MSTGKRQAEQKRTQEGQLETLPSQLRVQRQTRGSRLPGLHVFSIERPPVQQWNGSISLNALLAPTKEVVARSDGSTTPLKPLPGWCRGFEETWLRTGVGKIDLKNSPRPQDNQYVSDAVMCEEQMLQVLNIHNPYPLPVDHLLNLMYYNVFRGLTKNIKQLRLDCRRMLLDDCPSPFVSQGLDMSDVAPDFQPTLLQQTMPHHPCFDIFPDPVVRDNAINCWRNHQSAHQGRLCLTIAGRHTWHEIDIPLRHGCVLWGEPDCVEGWEVTEGFVQDWSCLVKGAFRLEAATNSWRAIRGEPPIFFA